MTKVLNLGGQEVEMRASALTPILYNNFYQKDFYEEYGKAIKTAGLFTGEIAFILKIQAEHEHPLDYIAKASIEDYYHWLEGFDLADIADNFMPVMEVLLKADFTNAKAKKKKS